MKFIFGLVLVASLYAFSTEAASIAIEPSSSTDSQVQYDDSAEISQLRALLIVRKKFKIISKAKN
jgi:hypothetical protein